MQDNAQEVLSIRRQMVDALKKIDHARYEMIYATLYQRLVNLGAAPQLRKKYRP